MSNDDDSIELVESQGSHCHKPKEAKVGHNKVAKRKIFYASSLCFLFMIAEFVGGYFSGSLAIMNDALHLLTDLVSFGVSYGSLVLSSLPATKNLTYGWHRIEIMGAMLSVFLMWVMTAILLYFAIDRLINMDFTIEPDIMLITAGIGIAINLVMGIALHNTGHGHSHGGMPHAHSHSAPAKGNHTETESRPDENTTGLSASNRSNGPYFYVSTTRMSINDEGAVSSATHSHAHAHSHDHSHEGKVKDDLNVRAAVVHVLGDLIQSVGVTIAAVVIFFKPEWKIVDPITTFLFSILVLATTFYILRDAFNVLMEGVPRGIDYKQVKVDLMKIDGVYAVHDLRIWSLTVTRNMLTVHVTTKYDTTHYPSLLRNCQELLETTYDLHESVIQIETYTVDEDECENCVGPQ